MLSPPGSRYRTELNFSSHDGAVLTYLHWPAETASGEGIALVHRGDEHSPDWQETVEALGMRDCHLFVWNARRHRATAGPPGTGDDIAASMADLDAFARHLRAHHGVETRDLVVIAPSVGAVVAAAWVHDCAPALRGLVLAAPAFRWRRDRPPAVPQRRLKQLIFGPGFFGGEAAAGTHARDALQGQVHPADGKIVREFDGNPLDLHETGARLTEDAGAIRVPTLVLVGAADTVADNTFPERFVQRLGAVDKALVLQPGLHHAIFHEQNRRLATDQIRRFARRLFAAGPKLPPTLRDADRTGFTHREYLDLLRESRRLRSRWRRVLLGTVGRLSQGIALGWRTGFDSSETLDYVCDNRPHGSTRFGRTLDQAYLESPAWNGPRARRTNVQSLLRQSILEQKGAGMDVHVLDAACGNGRGVLETLAALRHLPVTAELRDHHPRNLDAAERHRRSLSLEGVRIVPGDALQSESAAPTGPRPTVAIISGLLELLPDNDTARAVLASVGRLVDRDGVLIYTNQPWHPQLRFFAGVLRNREGRPCVVRRRTQEELDELVRGAGFLKDRQLTDPWGISTVARARRLS